MYLSLSDGGGADQMPSAGQKVLLIYLARQEEVNNQRSKKERKREQEGKDKSYKEHETEKMVGAAWITND